MLSSAPPGMFIAAASVGGSPIARIEYGGDSVLLSMVSEPGVPTTQVSTPTRTDWCRTVDLDRLGSGGPQLVDHVEHRLRRHPGAGVVDGDGDAGPGGADGADQDGQRGQPGLRVFDRGLVGVAGRLQRVQRVLQFGDFGVQRGLALPQRIQQHQQICGARGVQGVAGLGSGGPG